MLNCLFLFSQLQSDLLELRDAHAKLRTTNEKLRRDKERFEKERESLKSMAAARRKTDFDDDRKINSLLQLVSNCILICGYCILNIIAFMILYEHL